MKIYWLAYLLSIKCSATLQEFLSLKELIQSGCDFSDPQLDEVSLSWKALRLSRPHLWEKKSFEFFCRVLLRASEAQIQFTHPGLQDYPQELLQLREIPFLINYLGTPVWNQRMGLSVVGSREPSADSEAWCERELARALQAFPLALISGGARGIDQVGHRVSIRMGLPTAVLLPSGIERMYPSSLESLKTSILNSGGVFVSEYLPETIMKRDFFPRRNRLIAALGKACLIIEARSRSGTLITALQAMEQGKPLLILPSHPYDAGARGGLDLMMDGATPVRNAEDLISILSAECKGVFLPQGDLVAPDPKNHYL